VGKQITFFLLHYHLDDKTTDLFSKFYFPFLKSGFSTETSITHHTILKVYIVTY